MKYDGIDFEYPTCSKRTHCGMGYGCCILCKDTILIAPKTYTNGCEYILKCGLCPEGWR